jgi:hypothetical protein
MLPERLQRPGCFYHPAGRQTLETQEEDGHSSSFSLGTSHYSVLELVELEQKFAKVSVI